MAEKGRPSRSDVKYTDTVAEKSALQAVLVKQDELIDEINDLKTAIKAITAKLDADAGVTDVDYASSITDSLSGDTDKVELK